MPLGKFRMHSASARESVHTAAARALHLLNAVAIFVLVPSGWAIYNAAPFYPVAFPDWATLGGGLAGALLWHFAAMWLLGSALAAQIVYRVLLARGGPRLLPVSVSAFRDDVGAALRFRLGHAAGVYNAIQRAFYLGLWAVLGLTILSGLALWKPVQFHDLAAAMGGYESARRVHFWCMVAVCGFLALHVAMALAVPRTLASIAFGAARGRSAP